MAPAIYEEKLAQARESIIWITNIQTLRRFFDADLDEEYSPHLIVSLTLRLSSLNVKEREAYVWWKGGLGGLMKQRLSRCRKNAEDAGRDRSAGSHG
ncbi:hypothetical protein KIF59_17575 [Enterobacter cloacae subsp. cloacae]|nr:hypothetical protein [Enterobacter cloacae subsp. cloacae]